MILRIRALKQRRDLYRKHARLTRDKAIRARLNKMIQDITERIEKIREQREFM